MSTSLETYQVQLVNDSLSVGALKFGSFTLKSGNAYAHTIAKALSARSNRLPTFDVLFGPAYKAISLAAVTSVLLHTQHNIDVGFAYDRKEAKDHGEGGRMVGASVAGKRVLILDDVMTAGTAVRGALEMIREAGGEVVGVVMALDREEIGQEGKSAIKELEAELGGEGRVLAILRMCDLIAWLRDNGRHEDIRRMQTYWEQFGVKEDDQ